MPPMGNGIGNKPNCCVGCHEPLTGGSDEISCHFSTRGFPLRNGWAKPCHSGYHAKCFKLGPPFRSRLSDGKGLSLTRNMAEIIPIFVCECCTVRRVLQREITMYGKDQSLLALERMRILDMTHHWAPGTMSNYQSKLRVLTRFSKFFECPILDVPILPEPPVTPAIPIMWAQQYYSLQQRSRKRFNEYADDDDGRVEYSTVRHLRSAVSVQESWIAMLTNPGQIVLDKGDTRPKIVAGCRATDEMPYTLMASGMEKRLGRKSRQVAALLDRHIRWIDDYCERLFKAGCEGTQDLDLVEICRVGLFNTIGWLGWLRGGEILGLNWEDCDVTFPHDHASQDLPPRVGAILLRLLEETKTEHTFRADVPVAYTSHSGISPGKWLIRLRRSLRRNCDPKTWTSDTSPLFCDARGTRWTSSFFRQKYLIPFLQQQSLEGDTYLQAFSDLSDAFWSLHCYRIGGRSHVSVSRPLCVRKATIEEVNEHGRWKVRRNNESMAERYRRWTLRDRLMVTYMCM